MTYQGIRASLLYQINDDWNVLLTQTYQNMDSQGVFYQMPNSSDGVPLQPLQVTLFNPSYDKDKFENTAWTVNGKIGDLKAVYTGGYLVRNVDQATTTRTMRAASTPTTISASARIRARRTATCFSPVTRGTRRRKTRT